jgi:hypothetical protein
MELAGGGKNTLTHSKVVVSERGKGSAAPPDKFWLTLASDALSLLNRCSKSLQFRVANLE